MDPKSTAVVLIEYQNDFTAERGALHQAVRLRARRRSRLTRIGWRAHHRAIRSGAAPAILEFRQSARNIGANCERDAKASTYKHRAGQNRGGNHAGETSSKD